MSGNGGGGAPTINRPDNSSDCSDLNFETDLRSPDEDVLADLKTGGFLDIGVVSDQGPIQAVDDQGRVAGTIMSRELARLLNCIASGTDFVAKVLAVDGGQCRVQVFAR